MTRPILSAFFLLLLLSGCMTWHSSTVPLPQLIEEEQPWQVRVTGRDSTTQVIKSPIILGDSVGTAREGCRTAITAERDNCALVETTAVMDLRDVVRVEVGRGSVGRFAGLVGGVLLGLSVVAFALSGS